MRILFEVPIRFVLDLGIMAMKRFFTLSGVLEQEPEALQCHSHDNCSSVFYANREVIRIIRFCPAIFCPAIFFCPAIVSVIQCQKSQLVESLN